MATKQASSRLRKELKAISADPPPHIHVSCDESNILSWSYLLEGPADTPYEGGWYWGRLKFPKDYPFAPPSILMMTPSGRFETNTRLCLSMSDYHPESWQPAWSLATVLKGLLSFMCEECPTAGAIDPPPSSEERRKLSRNSAAWNRNQVDFTKAFPEFEEIVQAAEARKALEARPAAPSGDDDRPTAEGPKSTMPETVGSGVRDAVDKEPVESFALGDVVRIHGLKARTDLNGCKGVIEAASDEASGGRLRVLVENERVSVQVKNLERLDGPKD
jgi:ubiquitin-conjugating enzyme E2 J2